MGKWSHPQPLWLGHLFYRRYPRSIRPAVFRRRPPAPQTLNSLLSPLLESIHCCSCSYYRCAPAKCKTSFCHLSAHSSMKTSFMLFPLAASSSSSSFSWHDTSAISGQPRPFERMFKVLLTEAFLQHFNSDNSLALLMNLVKHNYLLSWLNSVYVDLEQIKTEL